MSGQRAGEAGVSGHPDALLLEAYADGELAPADGRAVEGHLAHCPGCRRRLALLGQLGELFAGLPPEEAGAELVPRILARVRLRSAVRPAASPISTALAAGLLLLAASLLALLSYQAAVAWRSGGASLLLRTLAGDPTVLVEHPDESLLALVEMVPLPELSLLLGLILALALLGPELASLLQAGSRFERSTGRS